MSFFSESRRAPWYTNDRVSQWDMGVRDEPLFDPFFEVSHEYLERKKCAKKIQSFYAIKKVANLRGGLEKNDLPWF